MPRLVWSALLAGALALGLVGCDFPDCSFDTRPVQGDTAVRADASGIGETLTVAFVSGSGPTLNVSVRDGLAPVPSGASEATVTFSAEGIEYGKGDVAPLPPFASATRGDTIFVYVEGTLSPGLFTEACSPPEETLRVDVGRVEVPVGVRSVRVLSLYESELAEGVARALRRHDAPRPQPATFA